MLAITPSISIPANEIQFEAIRAQGNGGQNVNKVSTAIHLRFDIWSSSLPYHVKEKLFKVPDDRISQAGVIVIKAQSTRSQIKNKEEAILRLKKLILKALEKKKARVATKPTLGSKKRRLETKQRRANIKQNRGKVDY